MKKLFKRSFGIVLTICLLLSAMPVSILNVSADDEIYYEYDSDGACLIDNYSELQAVAYSPIEGRTYRLQKDIIVSDSINNNNVVIGKWRKFRLDLNGHTLSRNANALDNALFVIDYDAEMTVYDSSPNKTGTISYKNENSGAFYTVFHVNDGNLTLRNGNYYIYAPNSVSDSSIVFCEEGYVEIIDGYYEAIEASGGCIVKLLHYAYMYDVPECVIYDGTFYANNCCVRAAGYGDYLKFGCLYPSIYVYGGIFHTLKGSGNGFSYCNNDYGTVVVAGSIIPKENLNSNQRDFIKGAYKEYVNMENPAGDKMDYIKVNNPPLILAEDNLDYLYEERFAYAMEQTRMEYYRRHTIVRNFYPELYEVLDAPYEITIPYNQKNPPEFYIGELHQDAVDIDWYMTTVYEGSNTYWTAFNEHKGKTRWTFPSRPEWDDIVYIRMVVTYKNGVTSEDIVKVHFEELADIHTINNVEVHVNSPKVDEKPSTDLYIFSEKDYKKSYVKWFNLTDGREMTANETFKAGKVYKVSIGVETTSDLSEFDSLSKINGYVNFKKAEALSISGENSKYKIALQYTFEPCPSLIENVYIEAFPPVNGMSNGLIPSIESEAYDLFDTTDIIWYDVTDNNRRMSLGETFKDGHEYKVVFWVKANDGYEFTVTEDFDPRIKAYINGNVAEVRMAYEQSADEVVEVEYNFGVCDSIVSKVDIYDIDLPVAGNDPDFSFEVDNPDKYSIERIWWYDSDGVPLYEGDKFENGKEYQLELKLTTKKFNGVSITKFDSTEVWLNNIPQSGDDVEAYYSKDTIHIYKTFVCGGEENIPDDTIVTYGDVDGNGQVNAVDAMIISQYYVGLDVEINSVSADVNGDGKVNAMDAMLISQFYVGLINIFPVEA